MGNGEWGIGNWEWGLAIESKTLYPALTQALQETDMLKPPGKNNTSWQPAWNNGKTRTIRVPIALVDDILAYARAVDSKLIFDESRKIPLLPGDFLQEFTMRLIDRYIEFKRQNYHPNQNSRKLDTSTRAWDELRKFQKLVRESPQLLD